MERITSPKHIEVIAIVDGAMTLPPNYVRGMESASDWLCAAHPKAHFAAFFEARHVGPHPDLIIGGTYEVGAELGSVMRGAAS